MHSAGEKQLHDAVVLFARALALEVGAAVAEGKRLAGTQLADGRHAVDVFREPVLLYYMALPETRTIRVTDIIWLAV